MQISRGLELLDRSEFAAAAIHFERLIEAHPANAEAYDSFGMVRLAQGSPALAVDLHTRALALDPNRPEAHGNLGNALLAQGEAQPAVESYRRLVTLRPQLPEAHNNLGSALLALNRFGEAEKSFRRALALRPEAPGALFNLATALRGAGRLREAYEVCQRLVARHPGADQLQLLAHLQCELGQIDAAVMAYERAIALEPANVESLLGLSRALRIKGESASALRRCLDALALAPESAQALTWHGELLADAGRLEQSDAAFKHALRIAPSMPEAWAALGRYRTMSPDAVWHGAVRALLQQSLTHAQDINLRYALGKYLDDTRQFDAAFEAYREANARQQYAARPFDRAASEADTDRLISTFDADFLAAQSPAVEVSRRPVFVVGMPRSGTTLIEQILASHRQVVGAGELQFWHRAARGFLNVADGAARPPAAGLAREYLARLAAIDDGAPRIVDKMPMNFSYLGLIHAALPQARIIHIQRHPLDASLSIFFQAFSGIHAYANDLQDIGHYYRQCRRLMQHWRSLLPPTVLLEVEYETLVSHPEATTRRLLHHLDLPWDDRCLDFYQTERSVATASNWQVRQQLNTRGIDRWRNYASHLGPLQELLASP